jgi:hypothetical protein
MTRKLRWAALAAFLCFPLILYLGRPRPCVGDPNLQSIQCDPPTVEYRSWTAPVSFAVLAAGVLLLLGAALVGPQGDDDGSSRRKDDRET